MPAQRSGTHCLMLVLDSSGAAAIDAELMADAAEAPAPTLGELVERVQAGEPAAFQQLYRKHHRQVVSQLAFLVPRADLEDTLQEVFIEVFKSIKRFEGRSAFTTWLYRVTVHVAMKARRKQDRCRLEVVEQLPELVDPSSGPAEVSLSAERQLRVEALLENLSPKKRAVLVMHDLRGMEATKIAEQLDTNVLTVRTRLFYARREFEKLAAADPILAEFFT